VHDVSEESRSGGPPCNGCLSVPRQTPTSAPEEGRLSTIERLLPATAIARILLRMTEAKRTYAERSPHAMAVSQRIDIRALR
jgi:hypothetical protein